MAELSEFKSRRHLDEEVDYFYLAIVFSLILHLVFLLLWDLNRRYNILHPDLFNFLHRVDPSRLMVKAEKPRKIVQKTITFRFADVAPSKETVEPPKNAQLYGANSTRAANVKPAAENKGKAKLEGKQANLIRVRDQPVPQTPSRPQTKPTPKPPEKKPPPKKNPERKPDPKPEPKQITPPPPPPKPKVVKLAKALIPRVAQPPKKPKPVSKPKPPAPKPKLDRLQMTPPPPKPEARPKSLKEARERQAARLGLVGHKMRQEGGVKKTGTASLDVLGTTFGSYDQQLSYAIQQRWFQLMAQRSPLPKGMVVIKFRLEHNGLITRVETVSSGVDDLHTVICQMAIKDPSPFPRWPIEMRRQLQDDHRDITVSFTY